MDVFSTIALPRHKGTVFWDTPRLLIQAHATDIFFGSGIIGITWLCNLIRTNEPLCREAPYCGVPKRVGRFFYVRAPFIDAPCHDRVPVRTLHQELVRNLYHIQP